VEARATTTDVAAEVTTEMHATAAGFCRATGDREGSSDRECAEEL
jgi:hypothetical protein